MRKMSLPAVPAAPPVSPASPEASALTAPTTEAASLPAVPAVPPASPESPAPPAPPAPAPTTKAAPAVAWTLFILGFTAFLVWLNTSLSYPLPADAQMGNRYERAVVLSIQQDTLAPDPDFDGLQIGKQTVEVEVLTGDAAGTRTLLNNFVTRGENRPLQVGSTVVASSYDGFITGLVVNYSREIPALILVLLFLAVVTIIGRSKGLKAIFSLAFTLICVIFLFIPLLLRGVNPLIAASIVVILSCAVTLLSLNGWGAKTLIAGAGCILCTLSAGLIAWGFGLVAHLSTFNTPEAESLIFIAQNTSLNLHDILFAGIIIATSGALMDTAISLASALFELKELSPNMSPRQIVKSGMNIGRDIMGTMTNTLILAFTGSSINSLLIIFMYNMPFTQMINLDMLIIEIAQGVSGTIAIALAIPITTLLASRILSAQPKTPLSTNTEGSLAMQEQQ